MKTRRAFLLAASIAAGFYLFLTSCNKKEEQKEKTKETKKNARKPEKVKELSALLDNIKTKGGRFVK